MLIHNLFSKLVRNQLFYHIIFISELSKPESVCSMYPQGVGKNASFTKSAVIRDFFLSPWVNSLHTQPNDSFAVQPIAPVGVGHQYTQLITSGLPPAPQIQFLKLSQYSVKHIPARSTKNSLCNINHHMLNYFFYNINGLLHCEYIGITMLFSMNCVAFRHALFEALSLIRLQFCPAVGTTACGGGKGGRPWVYMEHELGGDKL